MLPVQSLFSTAVAKRVTHATSRNIQQWVTGGLITPTLVGKKKAGYRWSFKNLVELRTLVALRHEYRVSYPKFCRIAEFLNQEEGTDWSIASLVMVGGDVMWMSEEQWISVVKQPGQLIFIRYEIAEAERTVREGLQTIAA